MREHFEQIDERLSGIDCFDKFRRQLNCLNKVGSKKIGRPKDVIRMEVAVMTAKAFLEAGFKPSKSNTGDFAAALRVIFEYADIFVPDNMFPLTQQAMREITKRLKSDSDFGNEVRVAAVAGAPRQRRAAPRRRRR